MQNVRWVTRWNHPLKDSEALRPGRSAGTSAMKMISAATSSLRYLLNYRKRILIPVSEHKPNTNTFLQDNRKVRRRLCILMDTVFEEKESWTAGEQFCIDGRNNWKSSVPYSYFQKHLDGSTTTETPSTDHGWLLFIRIIWFWSIWMFRL